MINDESELDRQKRVRSELALYPIINRFPESLDDIKEVISHTNKKSDCNE
jgi:cell fate (sporulation/competence/biofilm development) regulator YmcA (YheA/YmcA/DUF963 family)